MHKLDKEVEDILQHWGVKGMKWDDSKKKDEDEEEEKTTKKPKKESVSKADEDLVNEVIRGNYGNGEERKKKLGKRYREIQDMVNEKLRNGGSAKPSSKTPAKKKGTPSYQNATVESAKKKTVKKHHPSYQHATVQSAMKKLKPKNKARSTSYLQTLKKKTAKELKKILSMFAG